MAALDHFKLVNDWLGHAAGDAALRKAARRISLCVRPYDSPCRYGGEEFLIVLPGLRFGGGHLARRKNRSALVVTPFQIPEGMLNVICSIGVSASSGDAGFDATALLRDADEALYTAKNHDRTGSRSSLRNLF